MPMDSKPVFSDDISPGLKIHGHSGLFWVLVLMISIIVVIALWQTASLIRERTTTRLITQGQQQLDLHTA